MGVRRIKLIIPIAETEAKDILSFFPEEWILQGSLRETRTPGRVTIGFTHHYNRLRLISAVINLYTARKYRYNKPTVNASAGGLPSGGGYFNDRPE